MTSWHPGRGREEVGKRSRRRGRGGKGKEEGGRIEERGEEERRREKGEEKGGGLREEERSITYQYLSVHTCMYTTPHHLKHMSWLHTPGPLMTAWTTLYHTSLLT